MFIFNLEPVYRSQDGCNMRKSGDSRSFNYGFFNITAFYVLMLAVVTVDYKFCIQNVHAAFIVALMVYTVP